MIDNVYCLDERWLVFCWGIGLVWEVVQFKWLVDLSVEIGATGTVLVIEAPLGRLMEAGWAFYGVLVQPQGGGFGRLDLREGENRSVARSPGGGGGREKQLGREDESPEEGEVRRCS